MGIRMSICICKNFALSAGAMKCSKLCWNPAGNPCYRARRLPCRMILRFCSNPVKLPLWWIFNFFMIQVFDTFRLDRPQRIRLTIDRYRLLPLPSECSSRSSLSEPTSAAELQNMLLGPAPNPSISMDFNAPSFVDILLWSHSFVARVNPQSLDWENRRQYVRREESKSKASFIMLLSNDGHFGDVGIGSVKILMPISFCGIVQKNTQNVAPNVLARTLSGVQHVNTSTNLYLEI